MVLGPAPFCLSRLALITATCSVSHCYPLSLVNPVYLTPPGPTLAGEGDSQDPEKSEGNILKIT